MTLFIFFTLLFLLVTLVALIWVKGIDNMKDKHPDYKGEDFLHWDDDKVHTESDFH